MKAIYKRRLLKLAEHLEKGKLGHKKFSFRCVNADANGSELERNGCGALGCAIGELPIVFPRSWQFVSGQPALKAPKCDQVHYYKQAFCNSAEFFDIDMREANHLFSPSHQHTADYGGRLLGGNAKPASVARNIRAFVAKRSTETTI